MPVSAFARLTEEETAHENKVLLFKKSLDRQVSVGSYTTSPYQSYPTHLVLEGSSVLMAGLFVLAVRAGVTEAMAPTIVLGGAGPLVGRAVGG